MVLEEKNASENKRNILVSVVVPVFNVEKYIERCYESIRNQDYQNIEIIFVDDGSTDLSSDLCEKFKSEDSRVTVIHKKNEGLGPARNTGIMSANGEYIMFVDSDDYIELSAISELLNKVVEYDAEVVATNFIYDDKIETLTVREGLYNGEDVSTLLVNMMGNSINSIERFNVSSCTKLYNLAFLKRNCLSFPSERKIIWEDFAFNFEVFTKCNSVYVMDYAYYHYCYNGGSLTHKYNSQKFAQIMNMYEYIQEQLRIHKMPQQAFIRSNNMFIGNVRTCIKLEVYYSKENGRWHAFRNIKEICKDNRLKKLLNEIPNSEMTKQQYIYNCFMKHNCVTLVYMLAKLQNIRKKGLIN